MEFFLQNINVKEAYNILSVERFVLRQLINNLIKKCDFCDAFAIKTCYKDASRKLRIFFCEGCACNFEHHPFGLVGNVEGFQLLQFILALIDNCDNWGKTIGEYSIDDSVKIGYCLPIKGDRKFGENMCIKEKLTIKKAGVYWTLSLFKNDEKLYSGARMIG